MNSDILKNSKDLENIESFLNTHALPEGAKLRTFSQQLEKIDQSITQSLATHPDSSLPLKKQQELVQKLAGRCESLETRIDIIDIAEKAEDLANTSPERDPKEIAKEANLLRNRIQAFLQVHRPSPINAKFLRYAHACIEKAERQECVIQPKGNSPSQSISLKYYQREKASVASLELAELLYALAGILYKEEIDLFLKKLHAEFSEATLMELRFHIHECRGDLNKLSTNEERIRVIQGILGYAHKIADYYMDSTPYPSLVEIHHTFDDVAFVNECDELDAPCE